MGGGGGDGGGGDDNQLKLWGLGSTLKGICRGLKETLVLYTLPAAKSHIFQKCVIYECFFDAQLTPNS